MAELGLGTAVKNHFFGTPRSAYDTERTSGGSSGGSGGAVGSGIVSVALATDTTGGIRIPAACNGVVGYRPSVNRWPADFGLKLSSTMDSIGPIVNTVKDVMLLDELITEELPFKIEIPFTRAILKGIRIGVPIKWFFEDIDPKIMNATIKTLEALEKAGFTLIENDGIDDIEMISSDVARPLIGYEAPKAIKGYFDKHNVNRSFEFISGKLQSEDSRRLLRLLTQD